MRTYLSFDLGLIGSFKNRNGFGPCLRMLVGVRADGQEVHLKAECLWPRQIGHKIDGSSHDRDEKQVLSLIIVSDLSTKLADPCRDLFGVEKDLTSRSSRTWVESRMAGKEGYWPWVPHRPYF
jgi:hypothetical protein